MKVDAQKTRGLFDGRNRSTRASGFTFAEILAALMLLAVVLPVIMRAVTLSNRAAISAERRAVAVMLAENKLNELSVSNQWRTVGSAGVFDPPHHTYSWRLQIRDWREDSMTQLTLETLYDVQGATNGVTLSALVDESGSEL